MTAARRAYAKINIGLRVFHVRSDGYHELETVFHRIDLYDELLFDPAPTLCVVSSHPEVPQDESNLCARAALLLGRELRTEPGVRITLKKNIPIGSGLGGGSSDAATVLRTLPRVMGKDVPQELLHSLALELGSDVPYFLGRGSAIAGGRGDVLKYFDLDVPYHILVSTPSIHVSTAWAYSMIHPSTPAEASGLRRAVIDGMTAPAVLAEELRNDFEPVVFARYPEIGATKNAMLEAGAVCALMSGSGSSVFGFFKGRGELGKVASTLRARGHRTFVTPPHFLADAREA